MVWCVGKAWATKFAQKTRPACQINIPPEELGGADGVGCTGIKRYRKRTRALRWHCINAANKTIKISANIVLRFNEPDSCSAVVDGFCFRLALDPAWSTP